MVRESKIVKEQRLFQWILWKGTEPFQMSAAKKKELFGKSFFNNHCEHTRHLDFNGYVMGDDNELHRTYSCRENTITGDNVWCKIESHYYEPGKYSMTNAFTTNAVLMALSNENINITLPALTGYYQSTISIDHTAIERYYNYITNILSDKNYKEYTKVYRPKKPATFDRLAYRMLVARTLYEYPSSITENYYLHNCNRIIASSGYVITSQTIPSDMRHILFPEHYDVDIDNEYYSIMYNLAILYGIQDQFPLIRKYVVDKKTFRDAFKNKWKIKNDSVKQIFLSILFGGSIYYGSITKALEYDYYARSLMVNDHEYKRLRTEVEQLTDIIIKNHTSENRDGVISYGQFKSFTYLENGKIKRYEKSQILAFILSGYESMISDAIIKHYQPSAMIFDGFVSPVAINESTLHDLIMDELKLDITFSIKKFRSNL